jgi:hypothetical protein
MTHSLCTATSSLEKSERLTDNLLLALGCQNFIGLTFYFHNRIFWVPFQSVIARMSDMSA